MKLVRRRVKNVFRERLQIQWVIQHVNFVLPGSIQMHQSNPVVKIVPQDNSMVILVNQLVTLVVRILMKIDTAQQNVKIAPLVVQMRPHPCPA